MIVELSINLSLLLIDAWLLPFRFMKREEKKKRPWHHRQSKLQL